jgi:hypothetical protein
MEEVAIIVDVFYHKRVMNRDRLVEADSRQVMDLAGT